MGISDELRGLVVVSHGAQLGAAEIALKAAGITVTPHASGGESVHLVPYGDSLAVINDPDAPPVAWLAYPLNASWLLAAIRTSVELLRAQRSVQEARVLLEYCRAMGSERDVNTLHRFILRKARELTNADAGSLYLLEEHEGKPALRFAVAQTGPHDEGKYTGGFLPLSEESVAGSVAIRNQVIRVGDAYEDLPTHGIHFDGSFDRANDYHTKSVLCAPIRNAKEEVVGVLQLVNRKPSFDVALAHGRLTEEMVKPFDAHDEEILTALAAQAGVVLENRGSVSAVPPA